MQAGIIQRLAEALLGFRTALGHCGLNMVLALQPRSDTAWLKTFYFTEIIMELYKYMPAENFEKYIINGPTIRFTPPLDFNDPFEF